MDPTRSNAQYQGDFEAEEDQSLKQLLEKCDQWLNKTEAAIMPSLERRRNVSSSSVIVRRHAANNHIGRVKVTSFARINEGPMASNGGKLGRLARRFA